MDRPICPVCNSSPIAINCYKNGRVYYRKMCDTCARLGKKIKIVPAWFKAGYRKKIICDKCGFRAKHIEKQMSVFYTDGNLRNNNILNLKTVCLNCRVELANTRLPWKEAPLTPDF